MSKEKNVSKDKLQNNLSSMSDFVSLFEKSWEFFTCHFKKLIYLLSIPILSYLFIFMIIFSFSFFGNRNNSKIIDFSFIFLMIFLVIFSVILAIIAKTGLYLYIKNTSKNISLLDILKMAKEKFLGFIWVGFLMSILIMFWTFLFIIPGIIFTIYYSLSYWVYVYEEKNGIKALQKSKELIKNHWWEVFEKYFFLYGLFFLFFFGSTWIVDGLFNNSIIRLSWNIIIQIIAFLSAPLFIVFSNFIYKDLKRIKSE